MEGAAANGLLSLVIINTVVLLIFAFSFAKPRSRDWRSLGPLSAFIVAQGVPVEWRIDGRQAAGCGRFLLAPGAGVRKILSSNEVTVISFTPQEAGEIRFNCGMGMMTRNSKFIVSAKVASAVPDSAPRQAQTNAFSSNQRGEVEHILKDYLLKHPEVLREAFSELEKRQQAAEAEQHRSAVKENVATIVGSPHQVVLGNPNGDVTMVEFFDYNCGYCKRALADMTVLMKADPKLRIVLKEFPVLGEGSVEAAQVAIAVRMQDDCVAKLFLRPE